MRSGGRVLRQPEKYRLGAKHVMRYDAKDHAHQPHILKFSGGRSSGMLLFTLLQNGLLMPGRGDVIIFNNTSAEHPATYAFVAECKRIAEKTYGIPFFWLQFQTYEDMGKAGWARFPTYRLVKPVACSQDEPDGYDNTGAVFEEMLAWKGYVPNIYSRICTETLKLFVTSEFIRDWLGNRNDLIGQGHAGRPYMRIEQITRHHQLHGGSTPRHVLARKKSFLNERPAGRPQQMFADFTDCQLENRKGSIKGVHTSGGRATLSGDKPAEYVSLVGFRADEQHRIAKMRSRNNLPGTNDRSASGNGAHAEFRVSGYGRSDGEHLYAPLECLGVGREDVLSFWKKQSVKLHLPYEANFSNCLFCFLKGKPALQSILNEQDKLDNDPRYPDEFKRGRNSSLSPTSIDWWIEMEKRYGRNLREENRERTGANPTPPNANIGFFGVSGQSSQYAIIKKPVDIAVPRDLPDIQMQRSCDGCTD